MSQYHFNPETYEAMVVKEVPAYHRLQEQIAAATIGHNAARILDLGTGTGVTARSVLRIHPRAQVVGIDESTEMLAAARHALPPETDLRMASLQEPLPAGPFDLVVSALAIHHLDGPGKADLFRRAAAILVPGARFVLGDVIVPPDPRDVVTPIDGVYDTPSTAADQLSWLQAAGFVARTAWLERDLAVLVGDLKAAR